MPAYYNENDPYAAQWLRNLIRDGLIAPGEVDERSITEVQADDLRGYTQCHFFAGIGGWSYALRLADWDDARPVWTGSCPCQPYSGAGKGEGAADPRNLWPVWFPLVRECRPIRVFGEQVESAIGHGWLDAVSADLEAEGYAVGAAVLGAHSVGGFHRRQRLWFVAHATYGQGTRQREHSREILSVQKTEGSGGRGLLGHADCARLDQRICTEGIQREAVGTQARQAALSRSAASPWANPDWLPCADGKSRPTQSGLFPLAHGVPNRVGRLRAYGNSVVPQVAAEFIRAYCDLTRAP